jgi:CubicO group peptidase (beta-lactamase class C family)
VNIDPDTLELRDLAQHYAGLPQQLDQSDWDNIKTDHDFNVVLTECYERDPSKPCETVAPPVSNPAPYQGFYPWSYSNIGFDWLGDIVARNDGYRPSGAVSAYEQDLTDNVLAPLGMTSTHGVSGWRLPANKPDWDARRAVGSESYTDAAGNTHFTRDPDDQVRLSAFNAPGGSLWASANDMMTWMLYSRGSSSPPAALNAAIHDQWQNSGWWRAAKSSLSIGLGWFITNTSTATTTSTTTPPPPLLISKGGATDAFKSFMVFDGDQRRGVFVLANTVSSKAPDGSPKHNVPRDVVCDVRRKMPPVNNSLACPTEA